VAPIEGGERRRRPSGVQPHAEEVARGARWHAVRWRRPEAAAVRHPEEGEPWVGRAGLEWAANWSIFGKFQRKSRPTAKATRPN
jgi:hypothetical protein